MPKAGSTTWVQIFLSLVGAGFGDDDLEQRSGDLATSGDDKLENRIHAISISLVAGAWTERKKMFLGGSFLNLADDNKGLFINDVIT